MLKNILTYFEMLIVPHALHCVDRCIFVFTSFDTVCCFGFSAPTPPSPKFFFLSDLASLSKSLTRELTVRLVGLPPPPLSPFFLSDLVLAPSSLHQPPPDKGHTVREYY